MTSRPRTVTVTVQEIDDPQRRDALPVGWTGVTWHWPDRDLNECREHIEANTDPGGPGVPSDLAGTLRFDAVECGLRHPVITPQERRAKAIEHTLRAVEGLAGTLRNSAEELPHYVRLALQAGATKEEVSALVGPAVDSALHDVAAIRGLVPVDDPVTRLRRYRLDHPHQVADRDGMSL